MLLTTDDCLLPFPTFPFEPRRLFWHKDAFMNIKFTPCGLLAILIVVLGLGCQKSKPPVSLAPTQLSPDTVVRVHWIGKNRLGIMAGAYYFMRIWELPQSTRLETQTLANLAAAPWHSLSPEYALTNQAPVALYRLLSDVVWNESYFEIRETSNQPAEMILALQLDPEHESQWETNLAAVAESLLGIGPVAAPGRGFGWSLERRTPPTHIELSRVGQWTLVSAGPAPNALLAEVTARIQRDHTPYVARTPGDWLEADVDSPRLAALLPPGWTLPPDLPKVSMAVTGDGGHVLTHAELSFPKPISLELQPWIIPTNLIHLPVVGFTAARGFKPALASWKTWNDLQIGPPPDQICSWALPGGLFQTYFAAPLPEADNQVRALAALLLGKTNPWLAAHGYVGFALDQDSNGVTWGNSPSLKPFVKAVADGSSSYAYGGLIPETAARVPTNIFYYHPSFPELLQQISGQTNLVYYHWELTGYRIESCLYTGQFLSAISRRPPMPLNSVGAVWLKTIMPRLGNCTTTVSRTGPNQLAFSRRSTVGLTAAELNFLAVWLESPRFPRLP
jgi:hypothetical protein